MSSPAPPAALPICPRCGGRVFVSNGDPSCIQCGWSGPTRAVGPGDQREEARLPSPHRKRGRCGKYV